MGYPIEGFIKFGELSRDISYPRYRAFYAIEFIFQDYPFYIFEN